MDEDKLLQRLCAETTATLIEKAGESGEQFLRAFLNGMLSAVAKHLVETQGPQQAYAAFQRIADECAKPFLEQRA